MFKRFKNFKISTFMIHVIITLAYPIIKAFSVDLNQVTVFLDAMTIIAFILIIAGIFYSLSLHGDFDKTKYIVERSASKKIKEPGAYFADEKEKREASFNYPLFLGVLYLIIAWVISSNL